MMRWLDVITDSMDEFEQTPGDGEGEGNLARCSLWDPGSNLCLLSMGSPRVRHD